MQKILFIDRDGCIIEEPQPDQQVDSLEKLVFRPGAITALAKIAAELDYTLIMVTNQDGLGTDSFPENTFWPAQNKMMLILENEGIRFQEVHIDHSFKHENLPTRKPGTAMLSVYLEQGYDLANSYVIGDRITDMQLAQNLGARGIMLINDTAVDGDKGAAVEFTPENAGVPVEKIVTHWSEIWQYLRLPPRKVTHQRNTRETQIAVQINLDGTGESRIETGIGFFDHMLDQLARHGGIDLAITTHGDLQIDEHHTIEDTAITLGEAFAIALEDKRGMERYGFDAAKGEVTLPMDDTLAQVAIDFGGRPWLVWSAEFKREKIGEMPTEMFYHFFKSFSDAAKCNLNIKASGNNEHHKIEIIFKGFARAIKMAVARNPNSNQLPSTKGLL
jgi:imidazoleglycerol-phosphate dehydratase/histidinol-phosphatase